MCSMGIEKKCAHTGYTYKLYAPVDLSKNWFVSVHDPTGKRIKRKYGKINRAKTFKEREALALALLDSMVKRPYDPAPKQTMRELAFEWIHQQPWRLKSRRTYESIARAFFDFLGSRKPTEALVKEFMTNIRQTRYETTYNHYVRKLKRILPVVGYPTLMEGYHKVRERRRPARFFNRRQINLIKAQLKGTDTWHFCEFQYYCFIRPREIRHLRAQHIMLEEEKILIDREFSKNGKSEYVAIPRPFLANLQYIAHLEPGQLLFHQVKDRTKMIGENTMWARHNKVLKELNFGKGYTLYSWKHTGAVHFIKNGGHVKQLQIQLRHHSLDQVNEYLRQMGLADLSDIRNNFPAL